MNKYDETLENIKRIAKSICIMIPALILSIGLLLIILLSKTYNLLFFMPISLTCSCCFIYLSIGTFLSDKKRYLYIDKIEMILCFTIFVICIASTIAVIITIIILKNINAMPIILCVTYIIIAIISYLKGQSARFILKDKK